MMPKQSEIEIPLLKCIDKMGGSGRPQEIYDHIREFFPGLTEADIAEKLASGGNKWTNRIQWVRQRLVSKREMTSPAHGVWAITENGRRRLMSGLSSVSSRVGEATDRSATLANEIRLDSAIATNLEELADEYSLAFKQKVLQKLQDLSPKQFERFAAALLGGYGFADIKVTGRSNDGGIDGQGRLKVGLASMKVAFQCKRWQGLVGRPEIDKFRGAIQGEFEQGIFFTTSDFTAQAQEASIKKGAAPVVLINGEAIVQLMVEKGLGVKRRPVEIYEDEIDTLFEQE